MVGLPDGEKALRICVTEIGWGEMLND